MNKYLLTAVSVAVLSANVAIAEGVVVYGKANLSLQKVQEKVLDGDVKSQDNFQLISNKSRFGLKGEEVLNPNIKGIYQMEMEVTLDSDTAFKQRNSFLGLSGNWGTVLAGYHDTPTKMIAKPIDLFNDAKFGDIDNVTTGEKRLSNIVMYRMPTISNINFDFMIAPGEDTGSDDTDTATTTESAKRRSVGNAFSTAATYAMGGLKFALGLDKKVEQKLSIGTPVASLATTSEFKYDAETDATRLVVSYDSAEFGVAGMVQSAKQSEDDKNSVTALYAPIVTVPPTASVTFGKGDAESFKTSALSAYYMMGNWKLKALTAQTTFDKADTKFKQMVVGADYKIAKSTIAYGYVAKVSADADGTGLGENATLGVGIDHNF